MGGSKLDLHDIILYGNRRVLVRTYRDILLMNQTYSSKFVKETQMHFGFQLYSSGIKRRDHHVRLPLFN
jgi:hypothetical protein